VWKLVHKIAISRFARTFAALLRVRADLETLAALWGQSAGNTVVEQPWKDRHQYRARRQTSPWRLDSIQFSADVVRMVSAGEQTGKVDVMLEKISDFYDKKIEATLSGLTSLIEPC